MRQEKCERIDSSAASEKEKKEGQKALSFLARHSFIVRLLVCPEFQFFSWLLKRKRLLSYLIAHLIARRTAPSSSLVSPLSSAASRLTATRWPASKATQHRAGDHKLGENQLCSGSPVGLPLGHFCTGGKEWRLLLCIKLANLTG